VIAHFDIDAFYASVAERDDPTLRGKPLAVAGASRRAVVLTASYAARSYGVRSAMPLVRARELCPNLIVSAPNFPRYRELSGAVFGILARGGNAVEGLSLDEAFVAIGTEDLAQAVDYARGVRGTVRAEVGLTISAGVAAGKMPAKIASDDAKPDGLVAIEPGREAAYLAPLPAGRLWGVGPKTQSRLAARGITTVGAIADLSDALAYEFFGRGGKVVRELARGHDERKVEADRQTRSVSSEETFEYDVCDGDQLRAVLRELAVDVARRLAAHHLRGATIGVKIKLSTFAIVGRQMQLTVATDDADAIERSALRCLARAGIDGAAVRLLGVRVATLTEDPLRELSLFPGE